ncbi:hypothetical protein [Ferrovibrio sp.]|uniref:portal protein n=1 Tax=Ferrovibrio sp. TaxID=1917215 RepID=UPI000CB5C3B7|nr:hypothetical protein [Ferrovibrio sp.]PJI40407.1 MAG: hypothetical protein CTR53_10375 [Ferrovibrio sp.]
MEFTNTPEEIDENIIEIETNNPWIKEGDELGAEIVDYMRSWTKYLQNCGLYQKWVKHSNYYYNNYNNAWNNNTTSIQTIGEGNRFYFMVANHLRAIGKNHISLATVNPPVFDIKAINSDADTQKASLIGNSVIDYYMHEKKLRQYMNKAVEQAWVFDAGFAVTEWDANEGREYATDGDSLRQEEKESGDIVCFNPTHFDVAYAPTRDSWQDQDAVVVRQFVPKQRLLSRYPHLADEINGAKGRMFNDDAFRNRAYNDLELQSLSDEVEIIKLFHRKTEWMPQGRFAIALNTGTLLYDSPTGLPYRTIPVFRMVFEEQINNLHGWSPINAVVPQQEALNMVNSTIVTNQANYGVQYVVAPNGSNINPNSIAGLVFLEYTGQVPPQGMNLTQTPGEIYNYRQELMVDMNRITGTSDVSRGEVPGSLQSGSALAFVASQTAQNQGPFLQNFAQFAGDIATAMLKMLRQYMPEDRTIAIFGKHQSIPKSFRKDDLVNIDRVICELGNIMTHSFAGRAQIAGELLNSGKVDAEGYLQVITTGNLQPMIEGPLEEINHIRRECEWLQDGKQPSVLQLDNHALHIQEKRKLLMRPEFRMPADNAALQIQKNIMQNIIQHQQMMSELQKGQPQIPQPGGMPAPTQQESAQASRANPAPDQQRIEQAGSSMPQMPQMPINPQTGARAQP